MARILDFTDGFESSQQPSGGGGAAASISNTPSGNLTSTNVQDALNELQTDIDGLVAGTPDATTSTKGKVKLAGDLGGTADSPTVPGLANKANTSDVVPNTRTVNGKALNTNITLNKGDVGLGNVDNTSDMNKPVSTAQQTAIDSAVSSVTSGIEPVKYVTEADIPLSSLDNIEDLPDNPGGYIIPEEGDRFLVVGQINASQNGVYIAHSGAWTRSSDFDTAAKFKKGIIVPTGIYTRNLWVLQSTVTTLGTSDILFSIVQDKYTEKKVDKTTYINGKQIQSGIDLDKTDIGLPYVDNTSDLSKPVSIATQTALNAKAPLASPALTGNPTAPTQTGGDNSTKIATTAFVHGEIADKASQTDLDNLSDVVDAKADQTDLDALETVVDSKADDAATTTALASKVPTTRTVNGHALSSDITVTKGDVGLGNVDNTSDANKPVSTAQQTALDAKSPLVNHAFGSGESIIANQSAGELKKIKAGNNVSLSSDSTSVTINLNDGSFAWDRYDMTLSSGNTVETRVYKLSGTTVKTSVATYTDNTRTVRTSLVWS